MAALFIIETLGSVQVGEWTHCGPSRQWNVIQQLKKQQQKQKQKKCAIKRKLK